MKRSGAVQDVEKRKNNKHFMSSVVRVRPALRDRWIEKFRHQTIGLTCHGKLFFKHTGSLEFSQTLQLIAGEALQKIENEMPIGGNCGMKESTDHRRARVYSGQV